MTALLLEITAMLALWLCLGVWQRDTTARGRRTFMGLCAAVVAWSVGALAEVHGALDVVVVDRIQYAGILAVPPLWLGLATQIRGAPHAGRHGLLLAALLVPGLVCYAAMFAGDGSGWMIAYDGQGGRAPGPLWWVQAGYGWTLAGLSVLQLLASGIGQRLLRRRRRRIALAVACCAPLAGNLAYATMGLPGLDATPFLLAAVLILLRSELFSGDLLQALPLSHHDLVGCLPTPLILTDATDRVTEVNPAAQVELGLHKDDALDRTLAAVLADAIGDPAFERWSIVDGGREVGHLLLLRGEKEEEPS